MVFHFDGQFLYSTLSKVTSHHTDLLHLFVKIKLQFHRLQGEKFSTGTALYWKAQEGCTVVNEHENGMTHTSDIHMPNHNNCCVTVGSFVFLTFLV